MLIEPVRHHLEDNSVHCFGLFFCQALRRTSLGKTRSWRIYVNMTRSPPLPRRRKRHLPDRICEPMEIPGLSQSHLVG